MWKRFGSPTGIADSGTEEEVDIAYSVGKRPEPGVDVFSQKRVPAASQEDLDQQSKVFRFKQSLSGKALLWTYKNPANFEAELRKTLCVRMNAIILEKEAAAAPLSAGSVAKSVANEEDVQALKAIWPRLSDEVRVASASPTTRTGVQAIPA